METAKPVMLIVRPSGRAKDDVEVCRRAGWQAEVLSPIEIETDEASLKRLPEMYARADAVFWVSPTAVETAVPYLNLSDGIKAHIAVGQGSRRALARYAGAACLHLKTATTARRFCACRFGTVCPKVRAYCLCADTAGGIF